MEHGVIHQIDENNYLVPSAINPDPRLPLDQKLGYFPYKATDDSPQIEDQFTMEPHSHHRSISRNLSVVTTGLVYRRMLHLPPIASGFWSKFISLCIQHDEILLLLSTGVSDCNTLVSANHLLGIVANVSIEWHYWRTGIMLIANDKVIVRVNSLRRDVFEDPIHQSIISGTLLKVNHFQYREAGQWVNIPEHLSEVIEIIIPVTFLADIRSNPIKLGQATQNSVSAKLMAKMLELIDEILKTHCEHLAMNGIYTVNDMLHLTPCPLCYGDTDHRVLASPVPELHQVRKQGIGRHATTTRKQAVRDKRDRGYSKSVIVLEGQSTTEEKMEKHQDKLYTFRVDECIQQTLISDSMSCPRHGELEITHLAPDIVSPSSYHKKIHVWHNVFYK